jgi:hypothetical protein
VDASFDELIKKKQSKRQDMLAAEAQIRTQLRTLLKNARFYGSLENATSGPPLTLCTSTTFENMAMALEAAVIAMQCLECLISSETPTLTMEFSLAGTRTKLRQTLFFLTAALSESLNSQNEFV